MHDKLTMQLHDRTGRAWAARCEYLERRQGELVRRVRRVRRRGVQHADAAVLAVPRAAVVLAARAAVQRAAHAARARAVPLARARAARERAGPRARAAVGPAPRDRAGEVPLRGGGGSQENAINDPSIRSRLLLKIPARADPWTKLWVRRQNVY